MPRLKLVLEYDGTNYVGWQVQTNGPSVQGRVQRALGELLGQPVSVQGASRTDSGVHAAGQVCAFEGLTGLPTQAYWMGLNGLLPDDIAVVSAEEVDPAFDARRWAKGKRYRYLVSNRRSRSPHRRHTHWEIYQPLEVEAMVDAARALVGRHDFSAFRAADCQASHSVREISRFDIEAVGDQAVSFVVEGTAFVKHMVRNMVGSLVEVGRRRQPTQWLKEVLESKNRARAGPTAPPHGLCLEEVFYAEGPRDEVDEE